MTEKDKLVEEVMLARYEREYKEWKHIMLQGILKLGSTILGLIFIVYIILTRR